MDQTPNLKLPYIMAAQAQKHVTHNEAIRALDAIVQLGTLDRDLSAPPASPAEGDRYIVAAGASGAWSGHDGSIAAWQDGVWMLHAPVPGWIAWVTDEEALVAWDGTTWVSAGGGSINPALLVGVNATADATNRLAVKSDASLFSHDDVTPGNGDHQMKINKATAGGTASQLYQTNFSGRAETGLTGDDDFHFKVSPDGSTFFEAILIDKDTGYVSFPSGSHARKPLTANTSFYVRTDGSDSNDGSANTAGSAFATIQKALDVVGGLDLGIYFATIYVNDGTYTITSALMYRGYQGGQVILRALNDPSTSPELITRTGTKATDEAAVRAAHNVVVQASTAINLVYADAGGAVGQLRGIAFIQTGAHANGVITYYSAPATSPTKCTFFGGGSAVLSDGRWALNNCLFAHVTGAGVNGLAGASFFSNQTVFAHATSAQLQLFDLTQFSMFGGKVVAAAAASGTNIDRGAGTYFNGVSFEGGVNGLFVSASDVQLIGCTFSGASTRALYLGNAGRAYVNGGSIASGATLIFATQRSSIRIAAAPTGGPTYSPALGVVGNNESYINT